MLNLTATSESRWQLYGIRSFGRLPKVVHRYLKRSGSCTGHRLYCDYGFYDFTAWTRKCCDDSIRTTDSISLLYQDGHPEAPEFLRDIRDARLIEFSDDLLMASRLSLNNIIGQV